MRDLTKTINQHSETTILRPKLCQVWQVKSSRSEAMAWWKLEGQVPPAPTAFRSDGEVSNGNTPPTTIRRGFGRASMITSSSGKRNRRHRHALLTGTTLWGRAKRVWT